MNRHTIWVIHPDREAISGVIAGLSAPEFDLRWWPAPPTAAEVPGNISEILILLGASDAAAAEALVRTREDLFRNNVFMVNFGITQEALMGILGSGVLHFFDPDVNPVELRALVGLFYRSRADSYREFRPKIISERREIELTNAEILDSKRVNQVLSFVTEDLRGSIPDDERMGISSAIYEILVNAVEHGNLGIDGEEKERLLASGRYENELLSRARDCEKPVTLVLERDRTQARIRVTDQGYGFRRALSSFGRGLTALSGRGIAIARHHFDSVRFNPAGNSVTLVKRLGKGGDERGTPP